MPRSRGGTDFSSAPDPLRPSGAEAPEPAIAPAVAPAEDAAAPRSPQRMHLVVVRTRPADAPGTEQAGETPLLARYWQPRDRQWREQRFPSLEHALHLFVDERGWALRQQQALDGPDRYELIFEAPRTTFAQAGGAELLEEEVGLSPRDVAEMVERVEERVAEDEP